MIDSNIVVFTLLRYKYAENHTHGSLYGPMGFFGHVLEDEVRPRGVKIREETAIPEGTYRVRVTYSPKFRRNMALLEDVPQFTGIRVHGGNTEKDTAGCPLVARNYIKNGVIQGSLEKEFTRFVEESEKPVYIVVVNSLRFS